MSAATRKLRAPESTPATLQGPAGRLELRLEIPETDTGVAFAVVCHPHPLYQGTMDNKVVHTLARSCNGVGMPSVRFNFRGVGRSEGHYADGDGELEDALAVIDDACARWPGRVPWLLGFSFGGVIAARAAAARKALGLVTVAPAVTRLELDVDTAAMPPWLLVQGDSDEVVPTVEVLEWVQRHPGGPRVAMVEGAGHFFHGRLTALRDIVTEFLVSSGNANGAGR